jgi:hypothetical protein
MKSKVNWSLVFYIWIAFWIGWACGYAIALGN